ncbi:hypothetical protein MMC17_004817 [Xylographa soralifera]|nr:hypothetical protein [Xylographa soralifera]
MASNCLVLGSNSSATTPTFLQNQQGQVDWVAFGSITWNGTSQVLQRFASADVQPMTFGAGIVLGNQFHISPRGQQRMEEALTRLKGIPAFQDLLWLGFGYRSLVSTMANTVGGIKCVALCSCLADVHSKASAAWILAELWKASGYPEEYEPSHAQFLALVKVCAGALVSTPFMRTIDLMLGDMLWKVVDGQCDEIPVASNFVDIAKALKGLFELSRGEVDSILIVGGGECSFIAALAHWLFDLKIYVEDDEDSLIFTSAQDSASAKVRVRYGSARSTAIQIPSTTYVLGNCRAVFDRAFESQDMIFIVRTPWDGCLRRTFGSAFQLLRDLPHHLGAYLGSLARIYTALALGELYVGSISRTYYNDFGEASFGQGFIHSVLSTFPELERIESLQRIMENAAENSFDEALRTIEHSIHALDEKFSRFERGTQLYRIQVQNGTEIPTPRGARAGFTQYTLGLCEAGDEVSYKFHPLYSVSLLYQGTQLPYNEGELNSPSQLTYTALSYRGVICYIDGLRELTCRPELVRLVHVRPGHINYKNRLYPAVRDFHQPPAYDTSTLSTNPATVLPASSAVPEDIETLSAKESFTIIPVATQVSSNDSIYCSYRVLLKPDTSATMKLHPGLLMLQILRRSGLIACSNKRMAGAFWVDAGAVVLPTGRVLHLASAGRGGNMHGSGSASDERGAGCGVGDGVFAAEGVSALLLSGSVEGEWGTGKGKGLDGRAIAHIV